VYVIILYRIRGASLCFIGQECLPASDRIQEICVRTASDYAIYRLEFLRSFRFPFHSRFHLARALTKKHAITISLFERDCYFNRPFKANFVYVIILYRIRGASLCFIGQECSPASDKIQEVCVRTASEYAIYRLDFLIETHCAFKQTFQDNGTSQKEQKF
jgi:hypothetical protein